MNDADLTDLVVRAGAVLDDNWIGSSTKPAPRLYPHQWSWDSAFIAIGNAHRRPDRAELEMRTLFRAQWSNGMVPHIVFGGVPGEYFPSAADWGSRACDAAPDDVATSGICQPPVHALAVERIAATSMIDPAFLEEMYEPLVAWHEYLFRERCVGGELVEVWHPWETGMDNSPAWDRPLGNIELAPGDVPEYRRVDVDIADPADRPTDREYDRYAFLMHRLRSEQYAPVSPERHPFRVRDVLFNSLLVDAERSLAGIARAIGRSGDHHDDRAHVLASAIERDLRSETDGGYRGGDAVTGARLDATIAGDLAALLADPAPERRERVVAMLRNEFLVPPDHAPVIPTVPVADRAFEPTRYWRGPCWINVMWVIAEGLDRGGDDALAARVRDGILALVGGTGCFEYFEPVTRRGCGSSNFAWSAALAIDTAMRVG